MDQNPYSSPPNASLWHKDLAAAKEAGSGVKFSAAWVTTSLGLLAIYLGFFHCCIGQSFLTCVGIGFVCWALWTSVCWFLRGVYFNRFEYLIHQVVGVDILMEGFNPIHQGYGFYSCAAAFWLVFVVYHFLASSDIKQDREGQAEPQVTQM